MIHARSTDRSRRALSFGVPLSMVLLAVLLPTSVSAHSISGAVDSPLPFAAYLLGAAIAVAASFAIILLGDPKPPRPPADPRVRTVPRWVRGVLKAIGLVGWVWIMAQTLVGGSSDADVASLFLWVYGWVGLALLSAFLGPVWSWIDPFTTLFDIAATIGRSLRLGSWTPQPWPARLGSWIAVVGMGFFVWLELIARVLQGRSLGMVLFAYTVVTLVGMAQYGRDAWRERAEVFSVWFTILGRMAPFALVGRPEEGRVARRPYASGLVAGPWTTELVIIVAFGTGSIIYDGLSQTTTFFSVFGFPGIPEGTLLLGVFLGVLTGLVLLVGRGVGLAAMGAGLLPVALGYLIAHYLSFLLVDGQRIVIAISDPLQQGWDLFGTAFFEPESAWLALGALWSIQVGAVIVGHIVGAWAGHAATAGERGDGSGRGRVARDTHRRATLRAQLPLALLMVGLTALTLWSLGQNLVFRTSEEHVPAIVTLR
ncbi:MAG: hypothetical protein KF809_15685 [Chloroflexi bacterium]|nr:hypothetical protein [Chloroflexota bacterium]